MEVAVDQIRPSQAMEELQKTDSQLVHLVLAGYTLTDQASVNQIDAASYDYNFPDEKAAVFIASAQDRIIGSLTLIRWPDDPRDKRGGKFWAKLRELDSLMAQRAVDINPLACDMGGVVVLPELRGQHVERSLLREAVTQVKPSIIVGNTKTVEAVSLRRTLVTQGYRIFYGSTEITPGREQAQTSDHRSILKAYLFAKDFEDVLPEGNVFIYHGGIAPIAPSVEGFPLIIQVAFQPLLAAQRRLGETATVMGATFSGPRGDT
ncbi:MAG: hypothetical protein Q7S76_00080 [bacterium]|nr:hypothetical protein [bacterium]